MPNLPERLEDWTIQNVQDLALRGVFESDTFDLKEMLPSDDDGKHRLRKACAAFANSRGGFLIFGVSADKKLGPAERIVGIAASVDFPGQFAGFPAKCEPPVYWDFRNPALPIDASRVIHVVFIPHSWKAPHAVAEGGGWIFPKRASGGTEPMSYSEVQQMFLGYYEKRLKLQLLRAELVQLAEASDRILPSQSEDEWSTSHLPTLELRVIETVLADTYSITHSCPQFLSCLVQLRPWVQSLNGYVDTIRTSVAVHPTAGQFRMATYAPTVHSLKSQVRNLATQAVTELDKILK
jgi:schlafen family protein